MTLNGYFYKRFDTINKKTHKRTLFKKFFEGGGERSFSNSLILFLKKKVFFPFIEKYVYKNIK